MVEKRKDVPASTHVVTPFSGVVPTYNRAGALEQNLAYFLDLQGLAELIIVDDCSTDGTAALLANVSDRRIRVVRNVANLGSPAARRLGIAATSNSWLVMLEDDVRVPSDFGQVLLRTALLLDADVVSAPWLHVGDQDPQVVAAAARAQAVDHVGLRDHPSTFPKKPIVTPFCPALAAMRRSVALHDGYDVAYRGNAWREETDFFVRVLRDGGKVILTPETYSYQTVQYPGGQRRRRLQYELWAWWNNGLFLRRHGAWLRSNGYINGALREQLCFTVDRARPYWRRVFQRFRGTG